MNTKLNTKLNPLINITDAKAAVAARLAAGAKLNATAYATAERDRHRGGESGMTLRDYFAGQALAAICSGIEVEVDKLDANGKYADHNMKMLHDCAGIRAYGYADAMLAARERKEDAK